MRTPLAQVGIAREDIRRAVHANNFAERILAFPSAIAPETVIDTEGQDCGGFSVDRSVFRKLLPDTRWYVYAAGLVDPRDADGVTITLQYVKDDATTVDLGTVTVTTAGFVKQAIGPFDVFGTATVPGGETIPSVRLFAQKVNTGFAELRGWTVWLRLLPSKQ